MIKKLALSLIVLLGFAGTVYALPTARYEQNLFPFLHNAYDNGTSTNAWAGVTAIKFYDTDAADGCAQWATNVLTSTGVACGSGSGGGLPWPFTKQAGGEQATTTIMGLYNGFLSLASSTVNSSFLIAGSTTAQNITLQNATTSGTIYSNGTWSHFGPASCGTAGASFPGLIGIEVCGSDNTTGGGVQAIVGNSNKGANAWGGIDLFNDTGDATLTHFFGIFQNSSNYTDTSFGTAVAVKHMGFLQNSDGIVSLISSSSTEAIVPQGLEFVTGGSATSNIRGTTNINGNWLFGSTTAPTSNNNRLAQVGIASSTNPQLSLIYGPATSPITFNNLGSEFDIATSSGTSYATSSAVILKVDRNGQWTIPVLPTGCLNSTSGVITSLTCASSLTFAWPFTKLGTNEQATSTTIVFTGANSLIATASSTLASTTVTTLLGTNATTTNFAATSKATVGDVVTGVAGTDLAIGGTNGAIFFERNNGNAGAAGDFIYARSRGTPTAKTAVVNGDTLGVFDFRSWSGSAYGTQASFSSVQNTTGGGDLLFGTGLAFNGGLTEKMRLDGQGRLGVATSTPIWAITSASSTKSQLGLIYGAATPGWSFFNLADSLEIGTTSPTTYATSTPSALSLKNVGNPSFSIGSSTPTAYLSVNPLGTTYQHIFAVGTAASTSLLVSMNGQTTMQNIQFAAATGTSLRLGDGTTALPSFSFTDDANNGIYSPVNDVLGFVTNGVERGRFDDSNGVFGVGTSTASGVLSPIKGLVQVASSTVPQLSLQSSNSAPFYFYNSGNQLDIGTSSPSTNATTTPAFTVKNSGIPSLAVGTTTPSAVNFFAYSGTTYADALSVGSATSVPFRVSTNGAVFAPKITKATGGTNQTTCYIAATGELIDETTTACAVSSLVFKNVVGPLNLSGLDTVMALKPTVYSYKENVSYDYHNKQYGFIAEDVASVDPHLAEYGTNGKPRTLDDRAIMATVVKSIQELNVKTNNLAVGKFVRTAEENYQWLVMGLMLLWIVKLQIEIKKK